MKRLWDVVSFVAVVNVLAAAGFAAWLWRTDRLDLERMESVRDLFAITVSDQVATEAALQAEEEAAAETAAATRRREHPTLSSEGQIALEFLVNEQTREANRRLHEETLQLQATLDLRTRQLDEIEQDLRDRETAWNATISDELARRIDEQFQKTLRLYEALAGKQAKGLLLELVEQGQVDQAVAYLDAMAPRAAAKTLKEMKSDEENELATQLLESIRVFGIEAEVTELPADGDVISSRR